MTLAAIILVLLALGVLYQRIGAARQRSRFAPPGTFVDVGGHRLHVICRGSGSPLVLLESGIAASSLSWAVVQPRLAAFTRVCAYDRAGLAWSDPASCPRRFDTIVDELAAVLARISDPGAGRLKAAPPTSTAHPNSAVERCLLVGHSFGSFVVSAYAARYPDRVHGLVLVDPPTEWLTLTPQRARLVRGGQQLSRLGVLLAHLGVVRACLALLTGGAPAVPRRFVRVFGPTAARTLARLVGEVRKLPPDVHPIVQALWCQPKCFTAMADHLGVLARDGAGLRAALPPPAIPLVVISSGHQPADQLAAHRALAGRSPGGRHVVAARATHWIQFDAPDLIVDTVRELLRA